MEKKIFRNLFALSAIVIVVTAVLVTWITYKDFLSDMETEIKQESIYIAAAVEINGEEYLEDIKELSPNRITVIDREGNVVFDTDEDVKTMGNHLDRPEVVEAFENSYGETIRNSDTVGQTTFYYAVRLENGHVLRVANTVSNVYEAVIQTIPYLLTISAIVLLLTVLVAKKQTKDIVMPINNIDLEAPLSNQVYEEIEPLLRKLDQQNQVAGETERLRREFSANVSHELKTPLTSISGYAEIIKAGIVKPEDTNAFAEKIYTEAKRMIALVEDIMAISRLDEGVVEMPIIQTDLNEIGSRVVERLEDKAKELKIRLRYHCDVDGIVPVQGVPHMIEELIFNLCDNALKYNKMGGTVDVYVENNPARVRVEDTGIGIPESHQSRIFERFYRVDKSHSKETGGTGLGLSIVKHIAQTHGAEIKLESQEGLGTNIEVIFPLEEKR